jgi:hypothetical protein
MIKRATLTNGSTKQHEMKAHLVGLVLS